MPISNLSTTADADRARKLPPVTVCVVEQELSLYDEPQLLIAAMVADVRIAHQRVWLETFSFADDAAGKAVVAALIERAKAGVDVRVIYDTVGSLATPYLLFDELIAAGVQVHAFRPIKAALKRLRFFRFFNRRDHRKLLVIDDRVAYFGGMNICDPRISLAPHDPTKAVASIGWRDVHVRLAGSRQVELAEVFARMWEWCQQQPQRRGGAWRIGRLTTTKDDALYFFASRPGLRQRRLERIFVPLLRSARHELLFSMAYFLPLGRVLRELLRAKRRGISVRVVIPGNSDVKLVQWATRHFCRFLLDRGIEIYERQAHMLHSKALVIDGIWTVAGSSNFDARSLRWNFELIGVIRSRAMAESVSAICRHEIEHSRQLRLEDINSRHWWEKVRDRLAWSLRRWL
jgi:cardiolipin synthase